MHFSSTAFTQSEVVVGGREGESGVAMDVISRGSMSSLNPNAPPFVPWAYRAVEDFSEEWWELVQSSPWFRDYWLRECFQEEDNHQTYSDFEDIDDTALPDLDSVFHAYPPPQPEEGKKERIKMELMAWGAEKWRVTRGRSEGQKYSAKAPKIVSVKVSPRAIQQPR